MESGKFNIEELYNFVEKYGEEIEFTGIYDINKDKGFIKNSTKSITDENDGREFIKLDLNSKTKIVWHSHPYSDLTSFPSLEDLDVIRLYPEIIHLIITKLGVYIIKAISNKITINDLVKYYFNFQDNKPYRWEYELLQKNFTSCNIIANKTIFLCFIRKEKVNDEIINKMINYCKKVNKKNFNKKD